MTSSLPDGFSARSVKLDDVGAINELVVSADEAVMGWSDSTEADLLDWWRLVDLERDSWIVEDGSVVAYGVLYPHGETADIDAYVHPGRELEAPPPDPDWPEGFRVDTFELEDARAFHGALNEAFAEEWNWVPKPFERWLEQRVHAPDFDPTLWFIVREGDEIAGVLRGEPERFGAGWVGAIGVLKRWRQRGLGLALLHHAFGEFYRRGQPRIALGVDAENPTGATRLYERAGMHVAYAAIAFQKELA